MSDSSEKLSERLREQVAALHVGQTDNVPRLGKDAQRRVLQSLVVEAGKLQRQRHQRVVWLSAGGGALLVAAAVLVYLRTPQPAAAPQTERAQAPVAACNLPVLRDADLDLTAGAALALGTLGELVTQPNTQLSVESSSPCELAVRLRSGTLAGDLHSLRPARLSIRTEHGEVTVTGTRFSVSSDSDFEVLLENGVVDVQLPGEGKLRMTPRTRLHKSAGRPAGDRSALSDADVVRLASQLQPPPRAAVEPAPVEAAPKAAAHALFESSGDALKAAEAARTAERWSSAREAYRFASQGRDNNAEIALLRWARLELAQQTPTSALRLVAEHKRRFPRGQLLAEAGWIEVLGRQSLGQTARFKKAARTLIERHGDTPQAAAARKLLEAE
jgi:hypothetical protein